jgi:hypothetical protein
MVQSDWDLNNSPQDEVIIVTDVKLHHLSHNIVNMNGYREEEVLGKSPKMFQGELQMVAPQ